MREALPARAGKDALIELIGELRIGDCDLALERLDPLPLRRIPRRRDPLVEGGIDERVDAADEKAGDAGDPMRIAALRDERLEAGDVSFHDLGIDLLRKQQRDVDVDPLANHLPDRWQPGLGARDLDHQIVAPDCAPQPPRLLDRALGVHRQIGRHFEADIAVAALRFVVDRAQGVGRVLDILNGEQLEELGRVEIALLLERSDLRVVIRAV